MHKTLAVLLLVVLSGCAGLPSQPMGASPCQVDEASYACQLQRYHDVAA